MGNLIVNGNIYTPTDLRPVGTMYYSFDSDGKQFRKKYIDAEGNEQKYVFEYRDEQNVAVQLPTGVVSHAKSDRKKLNSAVAAAFLMLYQTELLSRIGLYVTHPYLFTLHYYFLLAKNPAVLVKSEELRVKK